MHFFKKIKKNTCRYHYQNLNDTIYCSWDIEQLKLVILGHFLPFYSLETPKINILENEKLCWRYHHFTRVPKIRIIWCMVSEMWSETDRIFCHSGLLIALLPPPMVPENQNFENMKKTPGDIIILHKCTKNHDHMLYCSLDMAHNGCNCYFSFWANFCPFTFLTAPKIKILKNWKKLIETSSFYTSVPKLMIIGYILFLRCSCYFSFWANFCPFTSLTAQKIKILKKWKKKNIWRCHHFTILYQKSWSYAIPFLRYGAWRM